MSELVVDNHCPQCRELCDADSSLDGLFRDGVFGRCADCGARWVAVEWATTPPSLSLVLTQDEDDVAEDDEAAQTGEPGEGRTSQEREPTP